MLRTLSLCIDVVPNRCYHPPAEDGAKPGNASTSWYETVAGAMASRSGMVPPGPGTTPVYRFLARPRPVHRQEHHTLPGPRRLRPERPKRVLTLVIVKVQFAPRLGALGHRNGSSARHAEALVRPKRGSITEPPSSALGHQRRS